MPLIPFPDVPPVAGVPDLNRLPLAVGVLTGTVQAVQTLQGLDYFGFLPGDTLQWLLADDQGNAIVMPDSVVDLGYRGEDRIATYPVEQGAFAAYNKVAQPQELTLRLSCGGRNMGRDAFLLELDYLRTSLTLVNIVTPEITYRGYNVDRVDYSRKSSTGLSLITAEIHLGEIRTSAQASYSNTAQSALGQRSAELGVGVHGGGFARAHEPAHAAAAGIGQCAVDVRECAAVADTDRIDHHDAAHAGLLGRGDVARNGPDRRVCLNALRTCSRSRWRRRPRSACRWRSAQ